MTTINTGFQLGPPLKGTRRDLPMRSVPRDAAYMMWNWLPRGGQVAARPGLTRTGTALDSRVTGLAAYKVADDLFKMVAATHHHWYSWQSGDWTQITSTPLNGHDVTTTVFRVFKKGDYYYLLGVNGVDTPKKWSGSNSVQNVGGNPPVARCIACAANRVLLGNIAGAPAQVRVSSFNDFDSGWDSVQVVELSDTPGEIVAMVELGNLNLAIYKTDAIYLATATAALYPFRFDLKMAGADGPANPAAVVATPVGHYYFSRTGRIFHFNGVSVTDLGEPVSALTAATEYTIARQYQVFGFYEPVNSEVWFFYPRWGAVNCYSALVVKQDGSVWPVYWENKRFSAGMQLLQEEGLAIGDMIGTLSDYTLPLSAYTGYYFRVLLGANDGQVYQLDATADDDGAQTPLFYQSGIYEPALDQTVTVMEVENRFLGDISGLAVQLGYSDGFDMTWESSKNLVTRNGFRRSAKQFGLRYHGTAANKPLVWEGSLVFGAPRGRR